MLPLWPTFASSEKYTVVASSETVKWSRVLKGPRVIGGWERRGGGVLGWELGSNIGRLYHAWKVLQFMNAMWGPPLVFLVIYKRYDIHGLPKFSI